MTTMDLGRTFTRPPADYGPLADVVAGLKSSIIDEVVDGLIAQISAAVAQAVTACIITPDMMAALPEIILSPTFTVEVPGEDDAGEIEAMDRNTAAVQELTQEVAALRELLTRPVVKEVTRDTDKQITRVTETR